MAVSVDDLINVLTLEQIEDNIFRGRSPDTARQRVFGGQVLGQALMAVGRTTPVDRQVHSLHAYFMRPGDTSVPIVYLVERVRDGHSFTTRRVLAQQHGRPIFQMSASFQVREQGLDHQAQMPDVPGPDQAVSLARRAAADPDTWPEPPEEWASIDVRVVPGAFPHPLGAASDREPDPDAGLQVWLRTPERLPDDPLLHAAVLAYASDMTLLSVSMVPHALPMHDPRLQSASLDHAMWFHRDFRVDEWLLHDEISPSASNARGLGQGRIFSLDGRLVATTVQEGLTRLHTAPQPG